MTAYLLASIVWGMTVLFVVLYPVIVSVWVLLGMFIYPEFVAPFAAAVTGLVIHIIVFTNSMFSYLNDARQGLKNAIQQFHAKEAEFADNNKASLKTESQEKSLFLSKTLKLTSC